MAWRKPSVCRIAPNGLNSLRELRHIDVKYGEVFCEVVRWGILLHSLAGQPESADDGSGVNLTLH